MMEEAIVHGMTHERSSETSTERWVIDIRTCGARIAAYGPQLVLRTDFRPKRPNGPIYAGCRLPNQPASDSADERPALPKHPPNKSGGGG